MTRGRKPGPHLPVGGEDEHVVPVLSGDERDRAAEARDRRSEKIDQAAQLRDDLSEERDERAEARDERAEVRESAAAIVGRGAASDRAEASQDRAGSAGDRAGSAGDRAHAASDREASSSDRILSAHDRATSSIDELTGSHRRESGLIELRGEAARAQRTGTSFVLAFVDIDGLKAINDSLGHAAGDHLLRQVADTLRANLRPYDLIIRFGGDEFVCGMQDVHLAEAEKRFAGVNTGLATTEQASVSVGLAELGADDSVEDLIRRADADLYHRRGRPDP